MIHNFSEFYAELKNHDVNNQLEMINNTTIVLSIYGEVQVFLHNTSAETYFEFKRNGKRFAAYRPDLDKAFSEMLGYMNGTIAVPDADEYNRRNKLTAVVLISAVAAAVLAYIFLCTPQMTAKQKQIIIMTAVLTTLAIEIGIKMLIDKKSK